jgi:hypothetical protein
MRNSQSGKDLWRQFKGSERLNPIQEPTQPKALPYKEDAHSESSACTAACTSNQERTQTVDLEALAATLANLSPGDRAKLASLLLGQEPAPADGGANHD